MTIYIYFFFIWYFRVSCRGVPSLARGWVCNLLIQSVVTCQLSRSRAKVTHNSWSYFTVSFETRTNWKAKSPYLYPPETWWSSYTPGHWVHSPLLLGTYRTENIVSLHAENTVPLFFFYLLRLWIL
jgi:hypothetical protein